MIVKYAMGFVFSTSGDRVVLIQKARPTWQAGFLNGVGGHVEPGETPVDAMYREFEEETGLVISAWTQYAAIEGPKGICAVFKAVTSSIDSVRTTTDEPVSVRFVDSVLSPYCEPKIMSNLKYLIPMALDNSLVYGSLEYK